MSLVKAKDVAYETACLEKRIQFVRDLKSVLGKTSLISQTVDLYTDLIEDILYDVCLDVHRDIVMGVERDACGVHRHGEEPGEEREDEQEDGQEDEEEDEEEDGQEDEQEDGQSTGGRKRQARSESPRGKRQRSRRRVEASGTGTKEVKEVKETKGNTRGVQSSEERPVEAPTLEEMVKQAALHYGSATMLGVQMSYVAVLLSFRSPSISLSLSLSLSYLMSCSVRVLVARGSKGAVDMFGNMIQPVSLDLVDCPNCTRKVSSGRFAPHLEKCMGGGRQSQKASRSYAYLED